jgi:hypothetical protein
MTNDQAIIFGVGDGLPAAPARDHAFALVARRGAKTSAVAEETGAQTAQANATDENAVAQVIDALPPRRGGWTTLPSAGLWGRWRN